MRDEERCKPGLMAYCNGDSQTEEERRKRQKQRLIKKARWLFENSVQLLLESLDKNSIEFGRVILFYIKHLRYMEEKEICFFKQMANGKTRLFKRMYCCVGLKAWKKCPEYRCAAWPCDEDSRCPYHLLKRESLPAFENAETAKWR